MKKTNFKVCKKNKRQFAFWLFIACLLLTANSFSQSVSINSTGVTNSTSSMFEVLQPTAAASGSVGIFARHLGTATNAYAIWAEATGAVNKYAIVVPSGSGRVGIGTSTPSTTALLEVAGGASTQVKITGGTPGANKVLTSDAAGLATWTQTAVPSGAIGIWSGTIASIPAGWVICDGTAGTPDLRNRFVKGVNSAQSNMNTTGGTATTLVAANIPQMSGTFTSTDGGTTVWISGGGAGTMFGAASGPIYTNGTITGIAHTHNTTVTLGNAVPTTILPPYYVVAFIMKQ